MIELDKLIKGYSGFKTYTKSDFDTYGKVYKHTNENLPGYIPGLRDKKVLTVSASGDQLLNMMGMGCTDIDTFDMNYFSPLFQSLKMYAIKYLEYEEVYLYFQYFEKYLYLKFNKYLPKKERDFFDYIYQNEPERIFNNIFYSQSEDLLKGNNYFNKLNFLLIKEKLNELKHNHIYANVYDMVNFFDDTYDAMFLSNICEYLPSPEQFLYYLIYLRDYYLNDNGEIYYAYIYNTHENDVEGYIRSINALFKGRFNSHEFKDILENSHAITVQSIKDERQKDTVLVLKK